MTKPSWIRCLAMALVIVGGLVAAWMLWRNRQMRVASSHASEQLELTRTALAATENLASQAADESWSTLFTQLPQDASVALNRALNRVLLVDSLTESTSNALLDAEAKQAARRQLPEAIERARAAIADFAALSNDPVTELWLSSRVDLQEASLLPPSVGKSLRNQIFDRLAQAIEVSLKDEPASAILGGPLSRVLDELESPTSGMPAEIRDRAASTFATLSDQHPDNLFIALRAAKLNIDAQSGRAADAVQRTIALARAIEPTLRVQTQSIGLTPDELVEKIAGAIRSGDWQTANNQMLLWFNVLNSTDLVKTDRRRASPHPLDRLNFGTLRRLSSAVAQEQPVAASDSPLRFRGSAVGEASDIAFMIPIDIDLDLDRDLVTVAEGGLATAWKNEAGLQWKPNGSLELGPGMVGALVADLFMVDASDPQRLQMSASAPASLATSEAGTPDGNSGRVSSSRHSTFTSLLVYGERGARIVSVDGRSSTADTSRLAIVEKATGLEDVTEIDHAIAGDLEGDGDLDLVFATRNHGLRIFINRGNRTFFEARIPQPDDDSSRPQVASMAIVDLDRDLDLDIVTIDRQTGQVGLLENLLHLQFRFRELKEIPATRGATQIMVADLDGNVSWDLLLGGGEQTRVVYTHTADTGAWTVDRAELVAATTGSILMADFDNDSWPELLSSEGDRARVQRLAGTQPDTREAAREATGLELSGAVLATADFDLDGKLDVAAIQDGQVKVYQNITEATGHYLTVRFRGIDDNNANSGRVNHYAIGSVLELRFGPHYRAQVITEPSTHFGLDGFNQAASLRVVFPNGLTQTVGEPAIDSLVEEEQTLKGSCPYLYAWDGEKFAFVTDCLWAAPLGLQVAAGVVAKDRPWEYLLVDGKQVKERDGQYELRLTEELWEVAYVDQLSFTAVDHPRDVEVWTNEKVGPADIAAPTIHAFQRDQRIALISGRDTQGEDVTDELASADRQFVKGFDRRIRQGLCPPHWIDLDFGTLTESTDQATQTHLVITGWILPTDTSLNIQIDQNPEIPAVEFPSVWVPDASEPEGWRKAIPFMGFPGGKTKTIVVDVTQVLQPKDARLRIRTSAQVYWDHAELVVQTAPAPVKTIELPLAEAQLGYHGFSKRVQHPFHAPETYDYAQASLAAKWPPLQGEFTNFGDCRKLLERWDDEMVVMGSGDEVRLLFDAPQEPVPPGWTRDFVLHCVGWDKDADLNTLTGQSSYPLPFKSMTEYPPTHAQADEGARVHARNRSHLNRSANFREFWQR